MQLQMVAQLQVWVMLLMIGKIINCTFIGNSAEVDGGAFYSNADQNMGNIINSTFINNRAKREMLFIIMIFWHY